MNGQGWLQIEELALAFVLSAHVGLEREIRQKSAGLQTNTFIGVSAALFMLISKYGFGDVLANNCIVVDPSRVAAQVVSGIGFIGGSVIFMPCDVVRGLTTAASVWLTAAFGMTCGAGLPLLAVATTVIIRSSVDGSQRPRAKRYRRGRMTAEDYLDDARDWNAVRDVLLRPLGPDGTLEYRTAMFDLGRDEPARQSARAAATDAIVIVDGTFLQRAELAAEWDVVVFVDVSEEVATERGVARDAAGMGGEAEVRRAHRSDIRRRSRPTKCAAVRGP